MSEITKPHGPVSVEDRRELRSFRQSMMHGELMRGVTLFAIFLYAILSGFAYACLPYEPGIAGGFFLARGFCVDIAIAVWGIVFLIATVHVVLVYTASYVAHWNDLVEKFFESIFKRKQAMR